MSYYTEIKYFLRDEEYRGFSYEIGIKDIVFREKSDFQLIEVVDTIPFGRALITDGLLMITEMDEKIYHEMMVHVPMSLIKEPRNVLIIGGGDGGCAREVSMYECVQKIDLVDIDKKIVDITQKFFKIWNGVDFSKLTLYFQDGFEFLKSSKEKYDVILVDISAPIEIAKELYSKESFSRIISLLSDEGVFVIQSESIYLTPNVAKYIINQIENLVNFYGVYWVNVPSFLSPWSFVIGSKKNPPQTPKYSNLSSDKMKKLLAYSPQTHSASFIIPPFIENYLKSNVSSEDLLDKDVLRKLFLLDDGKANK